MRDAFGVQEVRYAGVVETDGLPTRPKLKNAERIRPEDASNTPAADQRGQDRQLGAKLSEDRAFALAPRCVRRSTTCSIWPN
jgi:chemotaxis protein MotB